MVSVFLKSALWALFLLANAVTPIVRAQDIKVTLLGTGTPGPVMHRFGPSTLVEAGGQKFLFDTGRGAVQRLAQLEVRWPDVQGVFFTHLHSDHVVGFPDLWLTGWLMVPRRREPLSVWGPEGTRNMMLHLRQAYAFDIDIRQSDDGASPNGIALQIHEIEQGVIYDKHGVRVTAFEVDHAPIEPAFGFRIDHAGHSVVLSGDTRASENLVRYAKGADLLVHEVASPQAFYRAGLPAGLVESIVAHHVTPDQAGDIFSRVKPRLAVYSHIVPPTATEQDIVPQTRKSYAGPLALGEDLMAIEVGEDVIVKRLGEDEKKAVR